MIRKNIYKWHRTLSLIIAVPVLLWAASGFMHPIMTNIRPNVATQWLMPKAIDSSKIKVPLQFALQQNHIESFTNFRMVHIDTNWFYQVQQGNKKEPVYLSTANGKLLPQGEWLYAQYLGKLFLEGQEKNKEILKSEKSSLSEEPISSASAHDCCDAATTCVLNNTKGSKVKDVSTLTTFNDEYKSVNKLLPVHKITFDRNDGIRIYVETTQDRFAFAVDNKRAVFDKIFQLFHTWSFLDFLGKGKLFFEIIFTLLGFITTLFGVYIFFITKTKKPNGNPVVKARRSHRITSISISLFTLLFTFSGAYHAFSKFEDDTRNQFYDEHWFKSASANFDFFLISKAVQKPLTNISIVCINNNNYWQVNTKKDKPVNSNKQESTGKDLVKKAEVAPPSAVYLSTTDLTVLKNGEIAYANYLATAFSKNASIKSTTPITKFEGEYGFVNKRLPVFKVSYNNNERYYIETASGKLSVRIDDKDLWEGYSFSFLHKHHFMDFAGKSWRDFSTMFWAAAQIAMVIVGLALYFKLKRKSKKLN